MCTGMIAGCNEQLKKVLTSYKPKMRPFCLRSIDGNCWSFLDQSQEVGLEGVYDTETGVVGYFVYTWQVDRGTVSYGIEQQGHVPAKFQLKSDANQECVV